MLFCNNEEVKPGKPGWEKYRKFRDEVLPTLSEQVIFKRKKPIVINEGTKLTEVDPNVFIPFEARDYDKEYGAQDWRYCTTAPTKNQSGKFIYKPLGKNDFKRSWVVDRDKNPDLIFFMMELCVKVKDGTIIYEDKRQEARKRIEKDDKATAVKFMITNNMSPLSPQNTGNEDLIRMIAAAWGVSQAHNPRKFLDEIRVELWDTVEISEKKLGESGRGYETFLDEIKSKERIVLRANIQRAVDNRVITYSRESFMWKYEGTDHVIVTISARFMSNPASGLFEHLLVQPEKRRVFYNTLEEKYEWKDELAVDDEPEKESKVESKDDIPKKDDEPVEFTKQQFADMDTEEMRKLLAGTNYHDIQAFAMGVLGLETHRKKKDEVIEQVVGYFTSQKLQPAD